MKIMFDREGSVEGLNALLTTLCQEENVTGVMIFACESNEFTPEKVDSLLLNCIKPLWGGVFPEIIYEAEKISKGTLAAGFTCPLKTVAIDDLKNDSAAIRQVIENAYEKEDLREQTMFIFADGLSGCIETLRDSLFQSLGAMPNYIGGGAGSLQFIQRPCIFTSEGLKENAAVLALVRQKSGVGVAHGWEPISEPHKITAAEGNRIISIDWQPAFEVYQEMVESLSGNSFQEYDFFHLAKNYPLGIMNMNLEMIVRDPIATNSEKDLICVGDVPVNAIIHVLRGDRESLLQGAAAARKNAEINFETVTGQQAETAVAMLVIDCISRVLYLNHDFEEELKIVKTEATVMGALTLGEFANLRSDNLAFHNKTIITALLQ
ncbi:FIST signal transduction protein [Anoxynatronum buryatiense]|uniref:Uncharacterized conserved protein, contains FIST_N domain n=1 Tax=Anoxynatronum buryatiense TaxID=489973 RepID=A0AA46AJB2_9CLOT|nr:FIST N-terminal domain-containing protein [Anoxynatronum buryatiense]SMP58614.1 Uncharacterized conserved protein, contains FIST_N domain [Anoxynatronum buryatiense]